MRDDPAVEARKQVAGREGIGDCSHRFVYGVVDLIHAADVGWSGRPARRSVARRQIAPLSYRGSGSHRISDFSASCVEAPGRRRIHHTKARPTTIQRLTAIKSQ